MSIEEKVEDAYSFVEHLLANDKSDDRFLSTAYLNSREVSAVRAIYDLKHALLSYKPSTPIKARLAVLGLIEQFKEKAWVLAASSRSDTSKMPVLASLLNVEKDLSKYDPDTQLVKQMLKPVADGENKKREKVEEERAKQVEEAEVEREMVNG